MQGVQVEYKSLPWRSVLGFGVKTAGQHMDRDCEAILWTDMVFIPPQGEDEPARPGMSMWELDFNKDLVNVIAIKNYLSNRCLGAVPNVPVPKNVFMVSQEETGMEKFFSRIGNDKRAVDPAELNTTLHTTHPILMDGENVIMAFKAGRDLTLFTSLRIMIIDVQGWTGKKVEYTSVPYQSVRAFSAESAGGWDRDSEIDIYTRNLWNLAKVELDFRKGKADIISIQKFLSAIVLGNEAEAARYLESREPIIPEVNPVGMDSFTAFLLGNSTQVDTAETDAQLHSNPSILLEDERVIRAFKQARDLYVYTTLRVLIVDVQGLRGKKVEYKSIPWKWCTGFEFETAGNFDRDAELYVFAYVPKARVTKQSILVKNCDIYEVASFAYNTLLVHGSK